jgi:GTP-binding protein HflX
MIEPFETRSKPSTAVLVGLVHDEQSVEQVNEYLAELEFLATTADVRTLRRFTQRMAKPDGRTYVGSGKLKEIKDWLAEHPADLVIFDDDLSPAQLRNIDKELKLRVLDRSDLILDIFAMRARTANAKVQVELARYEHMLPRLTRLWTHLERQRGGTGTRGGAGEKEIETDRRIVRTKISQLKEELKQIDRQKAVQRGNRGKLVRVALVGYTNVGKSTLMNLLSKSEVFAHASSLRSPARRTCGRRRRVRMRRAGTRPARRASRSDTAGPESTGDVRVSSITASRLCQSWPWSSFGLSANTTESWQVDQGGRGTITAA